MVLCLISAGWAWPVTALPDHSDKPELYVTELPLWAPIRPVGTFNPCSCISYAKWKTGSPQSEIWGNAWNIQPKYFEPQSEGLVLTREGKGHIAYYVREGDVLLLSEANYITCKVTNHRQLKINDPVIRGYL